MKAGLFDANYFEWPLISPAVQEKVAKLMETGNISFDESIYNALESFIKNYFNCNYALLTSNGTAAAFSTYHAINLKPEDEIVMPAYTHWATVLPAKHFTNKITFYDTEKDSFSPDLTFLEQLVSKKTKALVVCHLYGNPCNMQQIQKFCKKHDIILIEDISHSAGATIDEQKVGSFSDIAFFSMQASKIVFAGEGGALITSNTEYYARAIELGHPKRIKNLPEEWQAHKDMGLGFKFRLSTIHATIALDSFQNLEKHLAVRNQACSLLMELLQDIEGVKLSAIPDKAKRVYWQQEFFIENLKPGVDEVIKLLRQQKINAFGKNYEILPFTAHFKEARYQDSTISNTKLLTSKLVLIPPFTRFDEELILRYAKTIKQTTDTLNG